MSSFNGRVIELPGVIVDHFVGSNVKEGHFFFLSHCHRGGLIQSHHQRVKHSLELLLVTCDFCSTSILDHRPLLLFQLHAVTVKHVLRAVLTCKTFLCVLSSGWWSWLGYYTEQVCENER